MYQRNISLKVLSALSDTPVVLLNGARQTGKSTLAQKIVQENPGSTYYTLDDANVLASAVSDATSFVTKHDGLVVIDEVQKVPELFNVIKVAVDNNRKPGSFLLIGSANVLLLPKISESLAGRMEIISLWPFSQGELDGTHETFIHKLFSEQFLLPKLPLISREDVLDRILKGGYPEVLTRESPERRKAWFASYITALLHRDIKELANIDIAVTMPRLLSLLASRSSGLLNYAELSRTTGIAHSTLIRYTALLQTSFLIHITNAWSGNLGKRLVKTPKLFFNDTGLMAYLLGINETGLDQMSNLWGPLLENFVVNELKKQSTWSEESVQLFHFRSQAGHEVDLILENLAGQCVGIEVKSNSSVVAKDFKGLNLLAKDLGKRFLRGIVLYTGNIPLYFGENFYALPINSMWFM